MTRGVAVKRVFGRTDTGRRLEKQPSKQLHGQQADQPRGQPTNQPTNRPSAANRPAERNAKCASPFAARPSWMPRQKASKPLGPGTARASLTPPRARRRPWPHRVRRLAAWGVCRCAHVDSTVSGLRTLARSPSSPTRTGTQAPSIQLASSLARESESESRACAGVGASLQAGEAAGEQRRLRRGAGEGRHVTGASRRGPSPEGRGWSGKRVH